MRVVVRCGGSLVMRHSGDFDTYDDLCRLMLDGGVHVLPQTSAGGNSTGQALRVAGNDTAGVSSPGSRRSLAR